MKLHRFKHFNGLVAMHRLWHGIVRMKLPLLWCISLLLFGILVRALIVSCGVGQVRSVGWGQGWLGIVNQQVIFCKKMLPMSRVIPTWSVVLTHPSRSSGVTSIRLFSLSIETQNPRRNIFSIGEINGDLYLLCTSREPQTSETPLIVSVKNAKNIWAWYIELYAVHLVPKWSTWLTVFCLKERTVLSPTWCGKKIGHNNPESIHSNWLETFYVMNSGAHHSVKDQS